LHLSQADAHPPDVVAYADVLDANGTPVTGLETKQFSATIGSQPASILSVTPFETSGEGVAYVFLIDVSLSLTAVQFQQMQQVLAKWIDGLDANDRGAVLTFGDEVKVVEDFTTSKDSLKSTVQKLRPADHTTRLYGGLAAAMDLARRRDKDLPTRRVVVLLSDGENDSVGGLTKEELLERGREQRLPLYAIGYLVPPRIPRKIGALQTLAELARWSGGEYVEWGSQSLPELYASLRSRVRQVNVFRLRCERCLADGSMHRLQLNLSTGRLALTDGIDLRLVPSTVSPSSIWTRPWFIAVVILILLSVGVGTYGVMRRRPGPVASEVSIQAPSEPLLSPRGDGVRFRLTSINSGKPGQTREVVLVDRCIIGRQSPVAEIAYPNDQSMSARHCELSLERGAVMIRDLESKTGTFVNGVPIKPVHRLEDGDVILMGQTELRVTFVDLVSTPSLGKA